MASPCATMEARMEEMKSSLFAIERHQEVQGKAMEFITQQLGQLLKERRASPLPEDPTQHWNLEHEYTPEQA